jgi:hypothetical protein
VTKSTGTCRCRKWARGHHRFPPVCVTLRLVLIETRRASRPRLRKFVAQEVAWDLPRKFRVHCRTIHDKATQPNNAIPVKIIGPLDPVELTFHRLLARAYQDRPTWSHGSEILVKKS